MQLETHSVNVWGKLAGEDEAVNALLQTRDVHDLHKVAFHGAELLRVTHSLVFGVFTLHIQPQRLWHNIARISCWGCERSIWGGGGENEGGRGHQRCDALRIVYFRHPCRLVTTTHLSSVLVTQ